MVPSLTTLDATRFVMESPAVCYEFPTLELRRGEVGLLIWRDRPAREAFFNFALGSRSPKHADWSPKGEILIAGHPAKAPDLVDATLVARNPELQLSGFFTTSALEVALPLALHSISTSDQKEICDFFLTSFGIGRVSSLRPTLLSSGQKQRLLVASALASTGTLLLIDGPMELIDPGTRPHALSFIAEFCKATGLSCLIGAASETQLDPSLFDKVVEPKCTRPQLRIYSDEPVRRILDFGGFASSAVLEVNELEYQVPETSATLYRRLSFSMTAGAGVAVCGPNGSGKSTLAQILAGRLSPSNGQIVISGRSAGSWFRDKSPQTSIAFVDPDLTLTEKNVRSELERHPPGKISEDNYKAILSILEITDKCDANPFDLDWTSRRRLCLAKAIRTAKAVLYVDEPTLDADLDERTLLSSVLDICRASGLAVLVATNDATLPATIGFDRVVELPAALTTVQNSAVPEPDGFGRGEKLSQVGYADRLLSAWDYAADDWLERSGEFSFFWNKRVYPHLLSQLRRIEFSKPITIVDLGSGHGLRTAAVSRFLSTRGVKIREILAVDMHQRFTRLGAALFGPEIQFLNADLTDIKFVHALAKRLLHEADQVLYTSFFSLHDLWSLQGLEELFRATSAISGDFIGTILSPEWVQQSAIGPRVLPISFNVSPARDEHDWQWSTLYPVSSSRADGPKIPYFHRDMNSYERLIENLKPFVSVVNPASGNSEARGVSDTKCRSDDIVIISSFY